jgi:hypothetical protein
MQVLLWLLIPVVAGLLATIYLAIKYRPSRPANAHKGMAGLAKFKAAMTRPIPIHDDKKNKK